MSRAKVRLREKGIDANEVSASRYMHVPHTSLWIAPKGHALYDPRSLDPVDEAMARDMADRVTRGECPNTDALLVWEQGDHLVVGDGHGRSKALARAAEILGKGLMPLVEFFVGDEKAFLLARARRNDHGRFARIDAPSVLAFRVKQLVAVGADPREIADACPRGVGPAEVDALARWDGLATECKRRFDAGEAPIGLLSAVLDAPRAEQPAKLDKLIAAGVKTARGAKRTENAEREKAGEPRPRRLPPAKLITIAQSITGANVVALLNGEADFARGFAAGCKLAAGVRTGKLPKPITAAIKGACAKAGAS